MDNTREVKTPCMYHSNINCETVDICANEGCGNRPMTREITLTGCKDCPYKRIMDVLSSFDYCGYLSKYGKWGINTIISDNQNPNCPLKEQPITIRLKQ